MRETRMTFGEHLEELRTRIIMSLCWLALSTAVCLVFGKELVHVSLEPHNQAIGRAMDLRNHVVLAETVQKLRDISEKGSRWELFFADDIDRVQRQATWSRVESLIRAFDDLAQQLTSLSEPERALLGKLFGETSALLTEIHAPKTPESERAGYIGRFKTIYDGLQEISEQMEPSRLQQLLGLGRSFDDVLQPVRDFISFLKERKKQIERSYLEQSDRRVTYTADELDEMYATQREVERIYDKLEKGVADFRENKTRPPVLIKYTEGFMNYFKVGLIFGLFFSLPLILYEMWKFVGAGLYQDEQKYVLVFLPFSLALFVCGVIFGFYWMVPFCLEFLASWGAEFAELNFTLGNYVNLFFTLTILLGLVFQTPLVMIFLYQTGIVSPEGFVAARKYTLLGAVVFSTIVTPPDPLSWSMMTGPIMLLYELGIRICQMLDRSKRRQKVTST